MVIKVISLKHKKGDEDEDDMMNQLRRRAKISKMNNQKETKSVKEGVGEVITKVEGDEIKDEEAGDDGIAIPVIKGDGPETAAGIAGDIMDMGKPKNC